MHWGEQFIRASGWDAATRILMLAGKDLVILDEQMRTSEWSVSGCESPVWLMPSRMHSSETECQEVRFAAYSPGKIVRGLLCLILEPVQNMPGSAFRQFDFDAHVSSLKLESLLSPSRTNGASALISKLKAYQSTL